jgi:hypothetical protein
MLQRLPSPLFYRAAAACSIASAITTLLLIFLPDFYTQQHGFEGRMLRVLDPAYAVRSWVYLVHPLLTFAAALAVAVHASGPRPGSALVGAVGFALWAATETAQQTLTLFAFDRWRRSWLMGDAEILAHMPALTRMYDGLWDAMYVLLLIGFVIGNLALGTALVREHAFTRVVGLFMVAASLLGLSNLLPELGGWGLPPVVAQSAYPLIQPLGRALVGVWLWQQAAAISRLRSDQT